MKKLIVVGIGGHFNSCAEVIENQKKFKIVGCVLPNYRNKNVKKQKYNYLGSDRDLKELSKKFRYAFIAIGQIKNFKKRLQLYNKLKKLNFILPVIISPNSIISKTSKFGEGTIVMSGVIINRNVNIGKNSILNTNVLIEHDTLIGDNTHVSTSAVVNGNVKIGNNCFIGSKVIIHNNIKIGDNCTIGAATIVDKNIPSNYSAYPYFKKKMFIKKNILTKFERFKNENTKNLKLLFFLRNNCEYSNQVREIIKKTKNDITIIWSDQRAEKIPNIINSWKFDYIICFRSHFILPKSLIDKAKLAINFHPGPPNYRGSGCLNYALKNNEKKYGVTCHIMDEKIDHGPIIDVDYFRLVKNDNIETALNKTHKKLFIQAEKILKLILNNKYNLILNKIAKNKELKWTGSLKKIKTLDRLKIISMNENSNQLKHKIKYLHTKKFPLALKYKKFIFYLSHKESK